MRNMETQMGIKDGKRFLGKCIDTGETKKGTVGWLGVNSPAYKICKRKTKCLETVGENEKDRDFLNKYGKEGDLGEISLKGYQYDDVVPFEKMKLSLLNAGHSVLGILGALLGYDTIDEAINNQNISTFLNNYMDVEVTPTLGDLEGINLENYKKSLLERFGNINIKDQIDRICSETSAKFPIFILPTINTQLENKRAIKLAAFVTAAWAIYNLGLDENGKFLNIKDAMIDVLHKKAMKATNKPQLFLEIETVFGGLKASEVFVKAYTNAYQNIIKNGVEKGITDLNNTILNKI